MSSPRKHAYPKHITAPNPNPVDRKYERDPNGFVIRIAMLMLAAAAATSTRKFLKTRVVIIPKSVCPCAERSHYSDTDLSYPPANCL